MVAVAYEARSTASCDLGPSAFHPACVQRVVLQATLLPRGHLYGSPGFESAVEALGVSDRSLRRIGRTVCGLLLAEGHWSSTVVVIAGGRRLLKPVGAPAWPWDSASLALVAALDEARWARARERAVLRGRATRSWVEPSELLSGWVSPRDSEELAEAAAADEAAAEAAEVYSLDDSDFLDDGDVYGDAY